MCKFLESQKTEKSERRKENSFRLSDFPTFLIYNN